MQAKEIIERGHIDQLNISNCTTGVLIFIHELGIFGRQSPAVSVW